MGTLAVFIKHLHVWLVVISVGGFLLRFMWSQNNNTTYLQHKLTRIAPHIVDSLLLLSGISLILLYGLSPLKTPWLGTKLTLVVVYITFGYLALTSPLPKGGRLVAGYLALLVIMAIGFLAVHKPALAGTRPIFFFVS